MKPESLLRFYPRSWRERYGEEFLALIGERRLGAREYVDVFAAAAGEWAVSIRSGAVAYAVAIGALADLMGRILRQVTPPPDHSRIAIALAMVAVGYVLYRSNEWLFERTPSHGPRAFRIGVVLAFCGGVLEVWGRGSGGGGHLGAIDRLLIVGNGAFFWTWLLCTARRREMKA